MCENLSEFGLPVQISTIYGIFGPNLVQYNFQERADIPDHDIRHLHTRSCTKTNMANKADSLCIELTLFLHVGQCIVK